MKVVSIIFLFLSLLAPLAIKELTQGFRLGKLHRFEQCLANKGEEVDPLIEKYLKQPFHYLSRGMQCFVFESEDQEVVLKLFRVRSRKNRKSFPKLLKASELAFNHAKEETGLLYIHTKATANLFPSFLLKNRWGFSRSISLDRYSFVLQKKASPLEGAFLEASKNGSLGTLFDSYLALIYGRSLKGICNTDAHLKQNFGFLDGKILEIDFGNYIYAPEKREEEFCRFAKRMRKFLQKHIPDSVKEYDQKVASFYEK